MQLTVPVRIAVPDGATHYTGHLLDWETPYSVNYYKCTQIGVAGDHWWMYHEGVWRFVGHSTPNFLKPLPFHQPPMAVEVCIHGNDITNKMGIACPEGCLSNAQRGLENRELAHALQDFKQSVCDMIQLEVFDSFIVGQLTDKIMDPNFPPLGEKKA